MFWRARDQQGGVGVITRLAIVSPELSLGQSGSGVGVIETERRWLLTGGGRDIACLGTVRNEETRFWGRVLTGKEGEREGGRDEGKARRRRW